MSTSAFNPAAAAARKLPNPGASVLRDRLADLANDSPTPRDFFASLGSELLTCFDAAIVILHSKNWSEPLIHSNDADLLEKMDREVLDILLSMSTPAPISCNVPLAAAPTTECPRALRVELTAEPLRVATMVIYASHHRPNAMQQVDDLKRLQSYADAAREVMRDEAVNVEQAVVEIHSAHNHKFGRELNRRVLSGFHSSLDLQETCYRIANESRRLLGCDRVTVLVPKYKRFQVKCVSGVAVVDRRSNPIRATEKLGSAAIVLDRVLEMPSRESLPPQVQVPLDAYLDESGVTSALLIPLRLSSSMLDDDDEWIGKRRGNRAAVGILVIENFSGEAIEPASSAMEAVSNEAGIALRNALEHQSVFGLKIWKFVGRLIRSSRTPIWVAAIAITIGLLATALVYPVEHQVVASGTVEPSARRELFAAVDGSVQQLHVHDGDQVAQGDLLIQLENPELENRAESLAGQIQTALGRLSSIQAVRLSGSDEASQSSRLVLEERQLESELANLRAQQQVLKQQLAELSVKSPIDGTVVAWQIERRLMARPVNRGNLLCTVTNPDGPWKLRLTVPERNAGPIVDEAKNNQSLSVRFAIATMPERTFQATLDGISFAARMDELGNRVVDLNATVDQEPLDQLHAEFGEQGLRVGADVTAKIACGQRTLIRSWFSDVFDFVNRHVLFCFW